MALIYNSLLFFYHLAIAIASPFNNKASKWIKGRKGIIDKLKKEVSGEDDLIWFHCASLGEFEQGRPIIERIKKDFPQYKILISFFSPSGYEVRKDYPFADYICYLPRDTEKNATKFIEAINPKMVFFVKYEFWYHHLKVLCTKNIPLYCVSAVFRNDQVFFKWYGGFFVDILKMFTHIFVQDEESKSKMSELGIDVVSVAGDTRFDRVMANSVEVVELPILDQFRGENKLLIAGSTWKEDEDALIQLINASEYELKYVIAPHEISEANINRLQSSLTVPSVCYSEADPEKMGKYKVLVIDNIGMLSSVYRYASIVYVGGAFGTGLHNILEPAVYGNPVIFGPDHKKFKEAGELISEGGAFSISNYDELRRKVRFLLADPYILKIASEVSRTYIKKNTGATDKIMGSIPAFSNRENSH